jgi:phage gpG-like protein
MALTVVIGIRGSLLSKTKGFGKAVKDALQKAMDAWQRDSLPLHFKPQGQIQARYPDVYVQPRTKTYQVRKNKVFHTQDILTFSGTLKQNVTGMRVSVTGSKKDYKASLRGSNVANFGGRPTKTGRVVPDMRAELTALNKAEEQAIDQIMDQEITEFLHPHRDDPYETFLVT